MSTTAARIILGEDHDPATPHGYQLLAENLHLDYTIIIVSFLPHNYQLARRRGQAIAEVLGIPFVDEVPE